MKRPRILDLFCGAGGAAMGYHRAGFEVVGVDIVDQPDYPFEFHRMDVMDLLMDSEAGEAPSWALFMDAIHASPPCQPYSKAVTSRSSKWNDTLGKDEPALIGMVRNLIPQDVPYVIENVRDAYPYLIGPIELCGTMFGLPISRHRLFETSWVMHAFDVPRHPRCKGIAKGYALARGWDYRDMTVTGKGRRAGTSERWAEIMGIDWHMSQHQLKEAIPPAYTEWLGRQLLAYLDREVAA